MEQSKSLTELIVVIKGAGDLASGVATSLFQANIKQLVLLEVPRPLAVRRKVSFCEALINGQTTVEGIQAIKANGLEEIHQAWINGLIPVVADPEWSMIGQLKPNIVVDAILAKENLGTHKDEAELVIGLGPGFIADKDVHMVIETKRGHDLGRIIQSGAAKPNTGIPGDIQGFTEERVLRASTEGILKAIREIGDLVKSGDLLGHVDDQEIIAGIDGKIRGLIMSGIHVKKGLKIGDIDPRGAEINCATISDKSRAIGRGVLEAIMREFNKH